jgi:hypothetical protein
MTMSLIISSLKFPSVCPSFLLFRTTFLILFITDHAPYVTQEIKKILGDDYVYDRTNTFRALYRNFTQCAFIEDQ